MADDGGGPEPGEVAEYVAEMIGQLAGLAQQAGFTGTAALLVRAQASALADAQSFQLGKAAPDDAA